MEGALDEAEKDVFPKVQWRNPYFWTRTWSRRIRKGTDGKWRKLLTFREDGEFVEEWVGDLQLNAPLQLFHRRAVH